MEIHKILSFLRSMINALTTEISEENFREDLKKIRLNFIFAFFFLLIIETLALFCNTFDKSNTISLIGFFAILLSSFIYILRLLYKLIKTPRLASSDIQPKCKEIIDEIKRLKEISFPDKCGDIEKIIKDFILNHKNNQNFTSKLETLTGREIIKLQEIKNNINNAFCGNYRCVLLTSEYYELHKSMIHYFLSFYETIHNNRNNHITRIFPLPHKNNNGNKEISLTQEQRKIFLSYLLINMLTGIDTFVLEYNSNRPKREFGFFPNLDYVIAENGKEKKTELYFSYKNNSDATEPYAFKSNDAFLINTIINDFKSRLAYKEGESHNCSKLTMGNSNNYNRILRFLNLQNEEVNILNDLKNCISEEKYSTYYTNYSTVKKNTIDKIERWIKRSSNQK